jgi:ABC-type thiamin/hydroxymethylpyrimidine transport system permease subunit
MGFMVQFHTLGLMVTILHPVTDGIITHLGLWYYVTPWGYVTIPHPGIAVLFRTLGTLAECHGPT